MLHQSVEAKLRFGSKDLRKSQSLKAMTIDLWKGRWGYIMLELVGYGKNLECNEKPVVDFKHVNHII